jgi:alkylation response protein AidB-like acyl-CoA dehydrogenase
VRLDATTKADKHVRYTRPARAPGGAERAKGRVVDLEFTSDQEELRDSVRSFLAKECPIELVRAVVETGRGAESLWESMVSLDWPALSIPEADGGLGLSFVETAVVAEELGRVIAPGPWLATVTQFAPVIREVGTAEQRRRFLGAVAAGTLTGSLALTDHPRRWALDDVSMLAERTTGSWILSGTKHGVMADAATDELVVLARAADGLGAFVVPAAQAQLSPLRSLDASRPLSSATFDHVEVPDERVLGEPGSDDCQTGLTRAIEEATVAMALETVGTADTLFGMVLAYVKDRQQFGVPIGSFQAVKHKMTDMFVSLERARSLCYFAVAAIDENDPSRARAVAMAKGASDDCQRQVCQDSYQSFGGIAYTWEHDGHLFIKRAKTTGSLLGGSSMHALITARLLGVAAS